MAEYDERQMSAARRRQRNACLFNISLFGVLFLFVVNIVVFQITMTLMQEIDKKSRDAVVSQRQLSDIIDFEGFDNTFADNETDGNPLNLIVESRPLIVPNIVHLIYMNKQTLRFHEMIGIFSIYLNQKPDVIMIHCENCSFHGHYWRRVERVKKLRAIIQFNTLPTRRTIFGKSGKFAISHRGDFWRIMLLMHFGGIYLDNDVYLVNSLDRFRQFEMSLGLGNRERHTIGSQVLVAHKNARLLRAWFDTYRADYRQEEWYTNAGLYPGQILKAQPYLAHLEDDKFGVKVHTHNLYKIVWPKWREMFTYHLLINHRSYLDKENFQNIKEFDEENIREVNTTFGEMCREVLDRIKNEL